MGHPLGVIINQPKLTWLLLIDVDRITQMFWLEVVTMISVYAICHSMKFKPSAVDEQIGKRQVWAIKILRKELFVQAGLADLSLLQHVEKLFVNAERLEARSYSASEHVERLTPSLVAKAFRGELIK